MPTLLPAMRVSLALQEPTTGNPFSPASLRSKLSAFADDSLRGRGIGSLERTTRMIVAALRSMHGADTARLKLIQQAVPIVAVSLDSVHAGLRYATPANDLGGQLRLGVDFLPELTESNGPWVEGVSTHGARTVYGGKLGTPDLIAPPRTVGRIVLMLPPDRPDGGGSDYQLARVRDEIARYDQAAAVFVATLDLMPPFAHMARSNPSYALKESKSRNNAGRGPAVVAVSDAVAQTFMRVPLAGAHVGDSGWARVSLSYQYRHRDVTPQPTNILLVIPGVDSALASEYVVLSAHQDGRGTVAPGAAPGNAPIDSKDSVYNGADEGGTGIVALLAIAEHLTSMPARPKRSILLLWTVGEEQGGLGAEWFAEHPPVPPNKIVADIDVDMLGRGDSTDMPRGGQNYLRVSGSHGASVELGSWIDEVNEGLSSRWRIDKALDGGNHAAPAACSHNQSNFVRIGVPSVFITASGSSDAGTVRDDFEGIDFDKFARVTQFIDFVAQDLANRPRRPVLSSASLDEARACGL